MIPRYDSPVLNMEGCGESLVEGTEKGYTVAIRFLRKKSCMMKFAQMAA